MSKKFLPAIAVLAAAALVATAGCSAVGRGGGERRTEWRTAMDESGAPTKIEYSFGVENDVGEMKSYRVYLFNGADRPLKVHYKVFFVAREPLPGDQYVADGREAFALGLGNWEPVKVVVVKTEGP